MPVACHYSATMLKAKKKKRKAALSRELHVTKKPDADNLLKITDALNGIDDVTAAILAAALDGIRRELTPPPALEGWTYEDETAQVLPMTLEDALAALDADDVLKSMLGKTFVDTFVTLKADEVQRYTDAAEDPATREVTDWEVREYLLHY